MSEEMVCLIVLGFFLLVAVGGICLIYFFNGETWKCFRKCRAKDKRNKRQEKLFYELMGDTIYHPSKGRIYSSLLDTYIKKIVTEQTQEITSSSNNRSREIDNLLDLGYRLRGIDFHRLLGRVNELETKLESSGNKKKGVRK